ncbi:hypothetical protein GCM10009573_08850 [Agromyces bracchium]
MARARRKRDEDTLRTPRGARHPRRPRGGVGENPESEVVRTARPGAARLAPTARARGSDEQLVLGQLAVERHALDELLVGALADDAAVFHDHDAV